MRVASEGRIVKHFSDVFLCHHVVSCVGASCTSPRVNELYSDCETNLGGEMTGD